MEHTRPEGSTAPAVDFYGCGAADRYSNVYAYNIYDAATAQAWQEDPWYLQEQYDLWDMMQLPTANEAVG